MLDGLGAIDWTRWTGAHGAAGDVPGLLRDLAAADRDTRERARWCLYGTIVHQGVRYPASVPAIPFLLELLAAPGVCERHLILVLLAHIVTGELGVAADPVMYTGESDRPADHDESPELLRAVHHAAERGAGLYLELLHDHDPDLRGAAAYMLACLWTVSDRSVPALRARLDGEPHDETRALIAFALGRLLAPQATPDPQLARLVACDPAPLVRLLAAIGLLRLHGERAPAAALSVLVAAIEAPDAFAAFEELPCGAHDLVADLGAVVRGLPPVLARAALPALCAALGRADEFDAPALVETLLSLTFGHGESVMLPETFSEEQVMVLRAMASGAAMWTQGPVFFLLRAYGVPTEREAVAALVGLEVARDLAAEAAAQGRFFLTRRRDPDRAAEHFARAAALRPDDAGMWLQLGEAHLASERRGEALAAIDRALELAPDDGRAHFIRGQALADEAPRAAAGAFARAAAAGFLPAVARCNEATALALAGERDASLARLAALVVDEPDHAEAHYCLGLGLIEAGEYAASIAATTRAIALRGDHAASYYARACAHCLLGAREAALADVARAIELDPDLRDPIAADPDLAALAHDPELLRLVAWEPAWEPAPRVTARA